MKKLTPLFILMILVFSGCSTESLEDQGQISSFDAKVKSNIAPQEDNGISLSYDTPVCAGAEVNYCISFPQAYKPNGETKKTEAQLQYLDDASGEYLQIDNGHGDTQFCINYTFNDAKTYDIRYKAGNQWNYDQIVVEDCSCEESFSYDDAGDEDPTTYTFYYTPKEDMTAADLVFTFAQSVAISGFPENEGWVNNGNATSSTNETKMDLEACHTYEWTLTLEKDCSGHSGNSNLWTDFKVNGDSKKGDLDNIRQSCAD